MAYKRKIEIITAAGPQWKKQKNLRIRSVRTPNIWVVPSMREPALLSINRQIRTETLGLYYSNLNTFIVPIHDCNASLYLRFHAHINSLRFGDITSGLVRLSGMPHRPNMFSWCKAVHEGGVSMVRFQEAGKTKVQATATYQVVIAGLEIARTGRESDLSWEVVKKLLGSLMYAVEEYDERWVDQCM